MATIKFARGSNERLTKNFLKKEFDCHCGGKYCKETVHDTELSEKLQIVRDYFNRPLIPTSPYRCPTHNRNVGGGTMSYHMNGGKACDFIIEGVNVKEIAKVCEAVGFNGIGCYLDKGFVHADVRPESDKFFWYNNTETPTDTFGGRDLDIYKDANNDSSLADDVISILKKHGYL